MANPKGNEAALKATRYKAAWKSGSTRTIRVPVVLADATLDYAHRLDDGIESPDTMNKADLRIEASTSQFIDTSDSSKLEALKQENEALRRENEALKASPAPKAEIILPDADTLLNDLRKKRKKSKCELADIGVILNMLER